MKINRIHFAHIFITPVYLYWDFIDVLKGKHFLRLGPGGLVVCVSDGSSCTRNFQVLSGINKKISFKNFLVKVL